MGSFASWGCVVADRVVKVVLRAVVDDYKKGMREAAEETRTVGTQAEKLHQVRQSMQLLGTAGVAMGATLAAGIGVAVAKFAEFDQAMSFVAATGQDARDNIDGLRQAALDAGAATVFSATEAANAIEEMAKAGLSAGEILGGGLNGALDLAAAGGLEVADAAGIAATALKVFNLQGSDMSHVADLLAAGAGKAMGDVSDLSAALAQGGQVAAATGLSIEETTASLAAFASQGLLGSDAGTSFKTMLQRLTPQSAEAQKKFDELGISAYDAAGNFVGMADFAGQLQTALADLTPEQRNAALSVMFGADAVRAANVIYAEGEEGIRDWIKAVDDQGYAAETAATRLDNLKGDWEAFTGALDTAFISMGEGADGPLRYLIQSLTDLVDGFNSLPDWAQQLGLGFVAVASGASLVGGATLLAIPKVVEFKEALNDMGRDGDRIVGTLGKLAKIGGGAVIGFAAAAAGLDLLTKAMQSMGDAAEVTDNKLASASTGAEVLNAALGKGFGSSQDIKIAEDAIANLAEMLDLAKSGAQATGKNISGVVSAGEAVLKLGDELGELAQSDLPAAQNAFRMIAEEAGLTDDQMIQLIDKMEPFKKALTEQATAAGESADSQNLLKYAMGDGGDVAKSTADAYLEQADAVESLHSQFLDLIDAIDEANAKNRDAVSANIDYQDSLRDVGEQIANIAAGVEGFGRGFDITTAAGADNKQMLVDLSQSAWDAATAQLALDGDTAAFTSTLESQRQKLYEAAIQMGASEAEAATLRDTLLAMPDAKTIQVLAETSGAQSQLDYFITQNNGRVVRVKIAADGGSLQVGGVTVTPNAAGGIYANGVKAFAGGGFEPGIYPYTPGGIHKFAEEYEEAYLSLDPRRRDQSHGVWQEVGDRFGFQQPQAVPQPMTVTANLDMVVHDTDPRIAGKQFGRSFSQAIGAI